MVLMTFEHSSGPNVTYNFTQLSMILSYDGRVIAETISYVFLSGGFCLFGIITNIINMIIFLKQGLNTTINISFFSLALSDLLSVLTLQWSTVCNNALVVNSDIPVYTPELQYLTGAAPHVCFGHITCWITAYMTAERCLCIALPLKVKQIVTPRRTAVIISIMYIVNLGSVVPEYVSVYLDWKYYPDRQRSLLALAFKENRPEMEGLGFIFLAILGGVSFPLVVLFTAILGLKLKQQARWRMKATSDGNQSKTTSRRDIKTMNMVALIAAILIACYTPGVIASVASCFIPGFNIAGKEVNLFFTLWGFVFWLEAVNSSINIILYYKMSTKFRNMFNEMFGRCRRKNVTEQETKEDDN